MQIRFAQPQDAEALYQLNTLFNGHNCNSAKQIHAFLSAPHEEIILLAQEKLSSIGFCCAQLCRSFCYNAPTGIISELYVLPEYHRQGIATALLTAAEAELARQGVCELQLCTGLENFPAQHLYASCDYSLSRECVYQKQLPNANV